MLQLSALELSELRRVVQPLARQLAARISSHRRLRSTGRLDPRRTVRRSLQAGGVPLDVVMRRRHPHRPELVLLCDVSGSVAEFAQFTFTLVHALHDELRRVRSFAFVDGIAEVTDLFESAGTRSTSTVSSNAAVCWATMGTATTAGPSHGSSNTTSPTRCRRDPR